MIRVLVIVPVLGRPDRARPLAESLHASVTGPVVWATLLFMVSPDDHDQQAAVTELRGEYGGAVDAFDVEWPVGPGDYPRKINAGWRWMQRTDDLYDFALLGADDLRFHPGWVEAALIVQLRTGACVVGTNDLGNPLVMNGHHATHPLVHRAYTCGLIDNDDPGLLLNEQYDHSFVDNEFIGTAKKRGTFAAAKESVVEHMHPIWRKGENDATYQRGQDGYRADMALHEQRRPLWERP